MDDEWERFQKEMKEEAAQSAQIIEVDQEEATAERELAEIDEQIQKWSRYRICQLFYLLHYL